MVRDSLQSAYLDAGSQVLWENGERLFRRGGLPDDNGMRRAAGAPSRRLRAVFLCKLCLAVALPLLACARANAAEASDGQMSELVQATQNNPPKSDTASETPGQSQPPTTKQKAKPGVLEEVLVTGSRIPLAAQPAQAHGGSGNVLFDLNNIPFAAVDCVEIVSEWHGVPTIGGAYREHGKSVLDAIAESVHSAPIGLES